MPAKKRPTSMKRAKKKELPKQEAIAPFHVGEEILQPKIDAKQVPEKQELQEDNPFGESPLQKSSTLLKKMSSNFLVGSGECWITLNDDILGGLQLKIGFDERSLSVTMFAENESVKKKIESRISHLFQKLEEKGFRVKEMDIVVGKGSSF